MLDSRILAAADSYPSSPGEAQGAVVGLAGELSCANLLVTPIGGDDSHYPEARYLGEGGEVSVTYRAAESPADLTFASGTRVHYLATGSTTHGLFGLFRWEMAPGPGGAQPHFHRGFTESFHVIDGSPQFYDGRRWIESEPGSFVHVPEGGIHGFRNESGAPATMLIHFSPGAPRERYFEEIGELASMDEETRAAFFIEHDNHLV